MDNIACSPGDESTFLSLFVLIWFDLILYWAGATAGSAPMNPRQLKGILKLIVKQNDDYIQKHIHNNWGLGGMRH